jgi:hypothetical protein
MEGKEMKKKLLSLLMAGVMVAGMSVTASAQTQTITGDDTQTYDANVKVTGTVTNDQGEAPAGKIQVEVPTTLSFTVDQSSNFKAPTYTIANKSAEAVVVSVGSFKETDDKGGITLHKNTEDIASEDRSHVKLTLKGNSGEVDLAAVDTAIVISEIDSNNTDNIQLIGVAGESSGTAVDADGTSEEFNLVFKIKKKA